MDKKSLKDFGITMGIAFFIISAVIFMKHRYSIVPTLLIAVVFLILALLRPQLLKSFYIPWMKLAFILAWINTRLILIILFYLFFLPTGLILKIFGKDLLERKIEKSKNSYWRKKEAINFNPADYERQY